MLDVRCLVELDQPADETTLERSARICFTAVMVDREVQQRDPHTAAEHLLAAQPSEHPDVCLRKGWDGIDHGPPYPMCCARPRSCVEPGATCRVSGMNC